MNFIKRLLSKLYQVGHYSVLLSWVTTINAFIMLMVCGLVYYLLVKFGILYPSFGFGMPSDPPSIISILWRYLRVGIFEEGLFRYLIMGCLFIGFFKMSFKWAMIISSVMFGCAHFMNGYPGNYIYVVPQVTGATFAGMWFAYAYKKWGLHIAILAHALYDAVLSYVIAYYMFDADMILNAWAVIGAILFSIYLVIKLIAYKKRKRLIA